MRVTGSEIRRAKRADAGGARTSSEKQEERMRDSGKRDAKGSRADASDG